MRSYEIYEAMHWKHLRTWQIVHSLQASSPLPNDIRRPMILSDTSGVRIACCRVHQKTRGLYSKHWSWTYSIDHSGIHPHRQLLLFFSDFHCQHSLFIDNKTIKGSSSCSYSQNGPWESSCGHDNTSESREEDFRRMKTWGNGWSDTGYMADVAENSMIL